MTTGAGTVRAAEAVVEALVAVGVDHAYCVPGESFLGVLDALAADPRIRLVATRHEGGAAFMAEAHGQLTGRPAVCLGTRMVGAGNLAIGLHTAQQGSTPLVALIGQVPTGQRHREAFQEVELAHALAPVVKWAVEPASAERLGELVLRAGRLATSGRPGPVVVALREDLLGRPAPPLDAPAVAVAGPAPDRAAVETARGWLAEAARPVILAGGGLRVPSGAAALARLARAASVGVVAGWRRPDVFPNDDPYYLGHAGLGAVPATAAALRQADLVVAVGLRLDQYSTLGFSFPRPDCRLVHADRAADDLGGHGRAALAVVSEPLAFVEALADACAARPDGAEGPGGGGGSARPDRRASIAAARAAWERETEPGRGRARPGRVDQQLVCAQLRRLLPPGTITTTDAGNFSGWPARYLRWQEAVTFLGPLSGAMGYAVPAAVAARLARPDRRVVAFAGDGGFLMTGAEVETAVREDAPIVVLVYDNAQYGTIRAHQERDFPGRPAATALGPVDVAGFARSLGAEGWTASSDDEVPDVLTAALACPGPAVVHLRCDPDQLSVTTDTAP
jgi:acetolactate synthase-1/2/3 large subunit